MADVGEWESDKGGLDTAFSHSQGKVLGSPYLEKCTMKPFGPVDNGDQHLYGLDYKSAMWRGDEENPFHTEVGYWLWDPATDEVMKGFVVPRGQKRQHPELQGDHHRGRRHLVLRRGHHAPDERVR